MTTCCRSISLAFLGIAVVAGSAHGADAPLLVAVETAPGVDVGAADVRQIIATELGMPIAGAREANAATASDVLLVTVDAHEIRMSLRAGTMPVVSRTIAAPSDRPGRLHSIAWLAGNLVRDQVGPIVAQAVPPPAVAETRPPTQPPALPVSPPPPSGDTGPAAVVASRSSGTPDEIRHSPWSITASGGPAATVIFGPMPSGSVSWIRSTAYLVDIQHQSAPGSALLGVGLETGPSVPMHYFGVAALIGSSWHRGGWSLEGNLGIGAEVVDGRLKRVTVTNDSSQLGTETVTTLSFEPVPQLYARVGGIAGLRVARDFDLVARLGAHLSTAGQGGSFLSSTVGVRLRLP